MQVVILAGGLATRLGKLTKNKPKSLLEICGKPFIAHQIDYLINQGFIKKILLCIGHYGEQIENFIENEYKPKIKIEYSYDGPKMLGTAGAIKNAENLLDEIFFVIYGDSYLPTAFKPILESYKNQKKAALMTVYKNDDQGEKSNVLLKNGKIELYEKNSNISEMKHIDYGINIFSRCIFEKIEKYKKIDLSEIHNHLIDRKQLAGLVVEERYYEIGSVEGIKKTEIFINASKK